MTQSRNEGLLSRWSRRKQQSALESQQEELELEVKLQEPASPGIDRLNPEPTDEPELPVLTDADMPAIDTLTENSDFSGFMSSGVSDELRNLALRKLFAAPDFNIRDGLDEYDEDYTYFEKLGDIVTADMKHRIELEEAEKQEKLAAEESLEEPVVETVATDEENSEQSEAETESLMSEPDFPDKNLQDSKSDTEQPEAIKTANSGTTVEQHD